MFKNHEFRIRVAKKNENDTPIPTIQEVLNPESIQLIEEAGRKLVKNLAVTVTVVVVAIKLVDTLSEIAVKRTPAV